MFNLRKQILDVLEVRDGLCLDVESERKLLADKLAEALTAASFLVVKVVGGLISDATAWSAQELACQDARDFLASADLSAPLRDGDIVTLSPRVMGGR